VQDRRFRRDSAPSIAALIATVAGVVNLASIVWPSFDDSSAVQTLLPGLGQWAVSRPTEVWTSAAVGAGLLVLAGGLRRGLRWAWLATLALLAGGVVIHLTGRGGAGEAVLEAAFFGWLAGKSRSFHARRGPGDRRRIVLPLLELLTLTAVYGLVGLTVNSPELLRDHGVWGALGQVSRMAVGFGASEPLPGAFGRVFPGSVAALFLTGMVFIVLRALAPRRVVSAAAPTREELRASEDSLAYFSTRDDRITVRVRDGIVSYGAARSVALAAGDPLGPRDAWPAAVDGFLVQAAATGRVPAVLGCGRQAAKIYRAAGMRRIYLGDEAILYLATFDIETPGRKRAREGWRRGQREGMTATLTRSGDLSAAETDELKALSERWLGETQERGFSMALSRLFDPRDGDTWFLVARDRSGHASGFIHLVPWSADGAGVDAMRRDREAPNVINDFLIVEAARLLPDVGVTRLSLNFAFLRGLLEAAEREGAPWWTRLQGRVLQALSGQFQIESLYRFNEKFDPRWHRRYACVQSVADVTRVALAMGRAEGQLHLPWDRWHRQQDVEAPVHGTTAIPAETAEVAEEPGGSQEGPLPLPPRDPSFDVPAPTHELWEARACSHGFAPGEEAAHDTVTVEGTIEASRVLGGVTFLVLRGEGDGPTLQVILDRTRMGPDAYLPAAHLGVEDHVWVRGVPARSRRGEPSVLAAKVVANPNVRSDAPNDGNEVGQGARQQDNLTSPEPVHIVR
jgi:lysyl-tRNA synthetase class 2